MVSEVHTVRPPGAPNTGGWLFRPMPKMPEQWKSPEAQDQLLHEWLISMQSIPLFAKNRGLTVDQLFDWLHSEEITDRRKRLEYMAQQRAESLARLNLPDAIGTLAATMRDTNAYPKERRLAASAIVRAVAKADKERARDLTALSQTLADEDQPTDLALVSACPERKRAGPSALGLAGVEIDIDRSPSDPRRQGVSPAPAPVPSSASTSGSFSPRARSSPRSAAPKPILTKIGIRRAGTSRPPRRA
jgi:hypothetical protein